MASTVKLTSELAARTAHAVTQDVESWKQYLTTASRLYKYPFPEQLMIYAQRPDATACAGYDTWKKRAGRRRAPSYGNTGQNTPGWCRRRWHRGLRYRLEKTACRSSLNISPLSLRRTIGTSTRRTSSTSLTAAFWRSMMHITSVCSSKTPQPSAWPTPSCPGVD